MSEEIELQLSVAENEFAEELQPPSKVRIKEVVGNPVKKWNPQRLPKEYENMSLDEIIMHKINKSKSLLVGIDRSDVSFRSCKPQPHVTQESASISKVKVQNFDRIDFSNKVCVTYPPQLGIRMLCELGYMIVVELNELRNKDHPQFHARRWRACYYDGRDKESKIVGIGEAPRKSLAKESAALDFIQKMRIQLRNESFPKCAVPTGSRISPSVLLVLEKMCDEAVTPPFFVEDIVNVNGRDKYQFTVVVSEDEFKDSNYDYKYAKYGAAKKAYDALNEEGKKFPLDPIIKGDDCLNEAEYCLIESEELHVVHTKNEPPTKKLVLDYPVFNTTSPIDISLNEKEGIAECSWRDSSHSSQSSVNELKRIKSKFVACRDLPPNLKKIRQRMESRREHLLNSEEDKALNCTNTSASHCGEIKGLFPETVYRITSGITPSSSSSLSSSSSSPVFKRTFDGLKKPIQNLTITRNNENYDESTSGILAIANVSTIPGSSVIGMETQAKSKSSNTNQEGVLTMWESGLRNAVLANMEPSKNFRFAIEGKESREIINPNPFLLKPIQPHSANEENPFVHEVTITGVGFGENFELSRIGAKIGVLRNITCVKNSLSPTDVGFGLTISGKQDVDGADLLD